MSRTRSNLILFFAIVLCFIIGSPFGKRLWQTFSLVRALNAMNQPVHVYGRLIDQNGTPVADVVVQASISHRTSLYSGSGRSDELTIKSAPDGRFELHGHGSVLTVEKIEKEGYILGPYTSSFGFSPQFPDVYHPDKNAPEVIHLWKMLGGMDLLRYGENALQKPDGSTYTFNFLEGTHQPGRLPGDLYITVMRGPVAGQWDPFDWSYRIEVPNGGLVATQDIFMFQAPKEGYMPAIEGQFKKGPKSTPHFHFYIRSRLGHLYSAVTVQVDGYVNHGDAGIYLESIANPSGSRNLEVNKNKVHRAGEWTPPEI